MLTKTALLLALVPALALAEPGEPGLRDLMHARNYAMGGAFRVHGLGSESASGNPAALALYPRYLIELSGAWDVQSKYAFGTVAVADSVSSQVAAGLSYHLVTLGRGESRRVAHFNTVAMALPLSQSVFIGTSGRHLIMTGAREANAITMDAGLLVRPLDFLGISFSGHNLIDTNNPELSRYYALSVGYLGQMFTAAFDLRADFGIAPVPQFAYGAGVEYLLSSGVPLRAGYSLDTITGTQHVSGGLGFMTQGGGVDLAYRHELGGTQGKLLSLTFRIQMQ